MTDLGKGEECDATTKALTREYLVQWGLPHEDRDGTFYAPYWVCALAEVLRSAVAFCDPAELVPPVRDNPELRAAFVVAHRGGAGAFSLHDLILGYGDE